MKPLIRLALIALVGVALAVGDPSSASAQSLKEQVIGTWTIVSVDNISKDGVHRPEFGPNPKGIFIFERNGYYCYLVVKSNVPKYASGDRLMGTAEEYSAAAQGALGFFGTYSLNEADHVIALHVDGASYPNITGADRKFGITKLTEDELDYSILTPTAGSAAYVVLKRAK